MLNVNFWEKVGQENRGEFLIANPLVHVMSQYLYFCWGNVIKYISDWSCQDGTDNSDIKMSKIKISLSTINIYSEYPQDLVFVRKHGAD